MLFTFLNWRIAAVIRGENVLELERCMLRELGMRGHDVDPLFQMVQDTFIYTYIMCILVHTSTHIYGDDGADMAKC